MITGDRIRGFDYVNASAESTIKTVTPTVGLPRSRHGAGVIGVRLDLLPDVAAEHRSRQCLWGVDTVPDIASASPAECRAGAVDTAAVIASGCKLCEVGNASNLYRCRIEVLRVVAELSGFAKSPAEHEFVVGEPARMFTAGRYQSSSSRSIVEHFHWSRRARASTGWTKRGNSNLAGSGTLRGGYRQRTGTCAVGASAMDG